MNRRQFIECSVATAILAPTVACTVPNWVNTAIADLPEVIGIINSILSVVALAGPLLPPGIGLACQLVEAGLTAIAALLKNYQVSPNPSFIIQIDAWLTDVQKNLSAVLTAARVEDPATQALIATGVALAILVVQGIQALIPANLVASPTSLLSPKVQRHQIVAQMNTPIVMLTAAQLKASYNLVAVATGYSQQQVP